MKEESLEHSLAGDGCDGVNKGLSLVKLPEDIIIQIASFPDTYSADLLHLALTCRRLGVIVAPLLYIHPRLEHDHLESFIVAVKDPLKAGRIQSFTFSSDEIPIGAPALISAMATFTNLRDLWISSPYWHFPPDSEDEWEDKDTEHGDIDERKLEEEKKKKEAQWDYPASQDNLSIFFLRNSISHSPEPSRILPNLRTLYLFYWEMNSEAWFLDNWECLLSATIRHLTIDSALLEDKTAEDLSESPYQTPLESLYLKGCEINYKALGRMLRMPKALKRLKGDDNDSPYSPGSGLMDTFTRPKGRGPWLDVLRQQAHSLEEIDICWLICEGEDSGDGDDFEREEFGDFERLKTLKINRDELIPA